MTVRTEPAPPAAADPGILTRVGPSGLVLWTIAIGALVRIAFDAAIGYGVGESYYVATARQLALSYVDQPPLSLWVAWAALHFVDAANTLAVRLPFIAMFGVTTWLVYRLGARLFGAWAGAWGAVLLNLSFVFTISVGSWVQPDAPLFMFSVAAAIPVVALAFGHPTRPLLWWAAAGALFGLAALSKYHAALTLGGLVIFVATTPGYRAWFFHRGLALATVIAVAIFAPVLVWNAQNHWISFLFQGARIDGTGIHIDWLLRSVFGQGALIGVLVWPPLLFVFFRALVRGPGDPKAWFLACLAVIPIVLFTVAAIWADFGMHLHWQATGYVFLFPLLGKFVAERLVRGDRLTRIWLAASAAILLGALAFIGSEARTGWIYRILPPASGHIDTASDPSGELIGWAGLEPKLAALGLIPNDRLFAVVPRWSEAGKVDVEIGDVLPVVCLCDDPRNIAFTHDERAFRGDDAVILTADPDADPVSAYGPYFDDVAPLSTLDVPLGNVVALTVRIFIAHGYRGTYPMPYGPPSAASPP